MGGCGASLGRLPPRMLPSGPCTRLFLSPWREGGVRGVSRLRKSGPPSPSHCFAMGPSSPHRGEEQLRSLALLYLGLNRCDDLLHGDLRIGFLALEIGLPDGLADEE